MRTLFVYLTLVIPAFAGYDAVRPLTIDHTKVGGSDSANFTLLVSGYYPYLATVANSGKIRNTVSCPVSSATCPADLIYTSDAACNTVLSWQIESYDAASGQIAAWIKIPALSHTADTVVYECYGNAAVTTFQGGAGPAFDSNTTAVFHFSEASLETGDTVRDYGGAARDLMLGSSDGTTSGSAVAGKIAGGISLPNRGDQYGGAFAVSSALSGIGSANSWTVSAWLRLHAFTTFDGAPDSLFGGFSHAYPGNGYGITLDVSGTKLGASTYNGATDTYASPAQYAISPGRWYYTVATYDGSTLRLYVNGVQAAISTVSCSRSSDVPIVIGAGIGFRYANSDYDEARISSAVRSADWILAEYNNQNQPFIFYAVGNEIGSNPAASPRGGSQPFID